MTYAPDFALVATPVGTIRVEGDQHWVTGIRILTIAEPPRRARSAPVRAAAEQLAGWFDGALQHFDVALAPAGTPRGADLRAGLVAVGYGETLTYGELARRLGSAARAIGQLCARNPFPIVVPCHRVLSAPGGQDSYSAGAGPDTKQWLLAFERRHHHGE